MTKRRISEELEAHRKERVRFLVQGYNQGYEDGRADRFKSMVGPYGDGFDVGDDEPKTKKRRKP